MKIPGFRIGVVVAWWVGLGSLVLVGQGMPPEARKNIHLLFDQHAKVNRTVTLIPQGYVALTESADPQVAAALREHVGQMEARMKGGLMVRRHDPAFVEFARHYRDMLLVIEAVTNGLRVTVTGKTPEAVRVARNHAAVVTDFASHGWEAHDRDHPAVLTGADREKPAAAVGRQEGMKNPDLAEAGPKIVAEAFGKLSAALGDAIARVGVVGALEVCSEKAPAIATEVGDRNGVTLRRASIRARNPANVADEGERTVLADFAAALARKEKPEARTLREADGSSTYLAPIVMANPLCLQCHGTPGREVAPATLEAIRRLYPADQATGFRMGDLRGLWSVKSSGRSAAGREP
jgi:hypothetical protein